MINMALLGSIFSQHQGQIVHHISTEKFVDGRMFVYVWSWSPEEKQNRKTRHQINEAGFVMSGPRIDVLDRMPTLQEAPVHPLPPYGGISAECVAFFEKNWLLKAILADGYMEYRTNTEIEGNDAQITMYLRKKEEMPF